MLSRLGVAACLSIAILAACQPDSTTIVAPNVEQVPQQPLKDLPPSDGADPVVISYRVGETSVDSFTFDAPFANEINGNPWGVWFGSSEIVDDPPTPTGNDYWSMHESHAHDWRGVTYSRLYFIPPVRRFSFTHSTGLNQGVARQDDEPPPDAFGYYVLDTAFHYVIRDSIRANGSTFTTRIDVSTGDEDRIHHVLFKGYMDIDDLVIVRAGPALLECGEPVERGATATCTVDSSVDSVSDWRFTGSGPFGQLPVTTPSVDYTWGGQVVLSGQVSVIAHIGGDSIPLVDSLLVYPRTGNPWEFTLGDWDLDEDVTPTTCPFGFEYPGQDTLGINRPQDHSTCDENYMFTPRVNSKVSAITAVTEAPPVADGGPNDGLRWIESVQFYMYRATEINPWLKDDPGPGGEYLITTNSKKDKNACREIGADTLGKNDPLLITTYAFNDTCEQNNLDDLLIAIKKHEGLGTVTSGASANGHESRNRHAATQPDNDPHVLAETIVIGPTDDLGVAVVGKLNLADSRIAIYGLDHDFVTGNWANPREVFKYDTQRDRFDDFPLSIIP